MRIAPIVALLALVGCSQDRTGYLDVQRALTECSDGKAAIAALQADEQARRKAKAEGPSPLSDEQWSAQMQAKQTEARNRIALRIRRILPTILIARKLTVIGTMESMAYVPQALEVTDELIRRYDAGEGKDDKAAELAAAKAKIEALERDLERDRQRAKN